MTKYANLAGYAVFGLTALWMVLIRPQKKDNGKGFMAGENSWIADLLLVFILMGSVLLRFYKLGEVPYGLQQDEASIGYEAWSLLHYGIDRYGNAWPIYPITFGSGGGSPLMVYLTMLPTIVFKTGVFTVRFLPALFGAATVFLMAVMTGLSDGKRFAVITAGLTAICPWHVIFSRWALDSNTVPFWEVLMLLPLFAGAVSGNTLLLILGAIAAALCLYAYGTTTFVVPVFLLLFAIFLFRAKKVSIPQIVFCVVSFLLVATPLLFFYAYNYLGVEGLKLPFFSIQKLMAYRETFYGFDAELPGKILSNLKYLLVFMTTGMEEKELASTVLFGYAQMYKFTFPFFFVGFLTSVIHLFKKEGEEKSLFLQKREEKTRIMETMMLLLFACIFVFSIFIEPNVNRMIMFLVPMVFFQAKGWEVLFSLVDQKEGRVRYISALAALSCVLVLAAAGALFVDDYFSATYARETEEYFMPGYSEAIVRATEIAEEENKEVLSTYVRLGSPFMLAMYATETPPEVFMQTVKLRLSGDEFYVADSFGRYTFGFDTLPDTLRNTVLILYKDEEAMQEYASDAYTKEAFGNYVVVAERE